MALKAGIYCLQRIVKSRLTISFPCEVPNYRMTDRGGRGSLFLPTQGTEFLAQLLRSGSRQQQAHAGSSASDFTTWRSHWGRINIFVSGYLNPGRSICKSGQCFSHLQAIAQLSQGSGEAPSLRPRRKSEQLAIARRLNRMQQQSEP
jgi:hypothetical protein